MSTSPKHPRGLYYLFFAEMWERFGYYLMIGIFVLFMTDTSKGGMGLDRASASDIYGTFIAFVFLTPFLGGLLADRILGYRRSIVIGGVLMAAGYMCLAIPGDIAFYSALSLIIFGNGFFKPNISTLLGNLYSEKQFESRKDAGYNIFYMGINIGAFICNFFAAYLRHNFGWGYAFFAAGIGMVLGVIIFLMGMKHYRHADQLKPVKPEDASLPRIFGIVLLPAVLCGIIGWVFPGNLFGTDFGSLPVLIFYVSLLRNASKEDKKPIAAMLAIFSVVIVFWAVFKQNGTALTTWAEFYTDREMPQALVEPAKTLKIVQSVDSRVDSVALYDAQFRTAKDETGKIIREPGLNPYLRNLPESRHPEEGQSLSLISTELFQSVNPFFVVIFTPLVIGFFTFLRRRKKEPSTPSKIAWGLVISALSTIIMMTAVYFCFNGEVKSNPWWLVSSYAVITIGELFLSPMGLSLVSKLSPPRLTALMMGGWFLATSIGNKLSGVLATMWDKYDNKSTYFFVNFILLVVAAISIFLMLRWLKNIFEEYTRGKQSPEPKAEKTLEPELIESV
jgi:proton-dependent oligopeptide transporter, POT family